MRSKRVVIPKLLFLPVLGLALVTHHMWREEGFMNLSLEMMALSLVAIGAIGRIWVSAFMSGKKNKQLVVDGPYAIVRNPLYLFSLLAFVGAGLSFETLTFGLLFAAIFFATHLPTIYGEEQLLRQKFGVEFDDYARTVPRLIPRSWQPNLPAVMQFDSRLYTRAVVDSSLILSIFLVAQIIEWGHLNHVLPVYFRLP